MNGWNAESKLGGNSFRQVGVGGADNVHHPVVVVVPGLQSICYYAVTHAHRPPTHPPNPPKREAFAWQV